MSDTDRPWAYMRGETFIRLPKQPMLLTDLSLLRGKDLVRARPLDKSCHADVPLEFANG